MRPITTAAEDRPIQKGLLRPEIFLFFSLRGLNYVPTLSHIIGLHHYGYRKGWMSTLYILTICGERKKMRKKKGIMKTAVKMKMKMRILMNDAHYCLLLLLRRLFGLFLLSC